MLSAGKGPEQPQQKSEIPMSSVQPVQATRPNTPLSFTRPLGGQPAPLAQAMTSPTPTKYDPRMMQQLMGRLMGR